MKISSSTLDWYPRETKGETIRLIHALAMTNAVLRELYRSVLRKRELTNAAKWREVGDSSQSFSSDTLQGISSE